MIPKQSQQRGEPWFSGPLYYLVCILWMVLKFIWPPVLCVVVLGIMFGVVDFNRIQRSNQKVTEVKLLKLEVAILAYQESAGALPESLEALVKHPGAKLKETHLRDAWGELMHYRRTGQGGFLLWSCGPDEVCGGEDDLRRAVEGKKENRAALR